MGLDMTMYKYNKKLSEEEFNLIKIAQRFDSDYKDIMEEEVNDYKTLTEEDFIRKYVNDYYVGMIYPTEAKIAHVLSEYNEDEKEVERAKIKEMSERTLERIREETKDKIDALTAYLNLSEDFISEANELEPIELAYWRKHSDLNGLMENIYHDRGGKEEFNCVPLLLSKEDIEHIIELHENHLSGKSELPIARGFFWGETYREDWENSLEDFERILKETDWDNETVYYSCWW